MTSTPANPDTTRLCGAVVTVLRIFFAPRPMRMSARTWSLRGVSSSTARTSSKVCAS
jgi:hypothetical protein